MCSCSLRLIVFVFELPLRPTTHLIENKRSPVDFLSDLSKDIDIIVSWTFPHRIGRDQRWHVRILSCKIVRCIFFDVGNIKLCKLTHIPNVWFGWWGGRSPQIRLCQLGSRNISKNNQSHNNKQNQVTEFNKRKKDMSNNAIFKQYKIKNKNRQSVRLTV